MTEESKNPETKNDEQKTEDEDESSDIKISNVVVEMMGSLASIAAIKRCLADEVSSEQAKLAEKAYDSMFNAVFSYLEASNIDYLKQLDIANYIGEIFTTLSSLGYLKMGLPESNAGYRDLEDAKIAIDTFAALFETVRSDLTEERSKQLQTLLVNLQMSFVTQTGEKK